MDIVVVCSGEERAEMESKPVNLPVNLHSNFTYGHELWVVTKRIRLKIQVTSFCGILIKSVNEQKS